MVIPRSYPRAAGIQSEVKKETVTRIAGMEVDLRHQVGVYQKNLAITVNNINKEQLFLRRSMTNLNNKKMQIKKHKDKAKHRKGLRPTKQFISPFETKPLHIERLTLPDNDDTSSITETSRESLPSANYRHRGTSEKRGDGKVGRSIFDDNNSECGSEKSDSIPEDNNMKRNIRKGPISARSVTFCQNLPEISEEKDDENTTLPSRINVIQPGGNSFMNASNLVKCSTAPEIDLTSSGRKPKKKSKRQAISFSDLIKMQHSSDSNQLFGLVNKLAKEHGIDVVETSNCNNVVDPRQAFVHKDSRHRSEYAEQLNRKVSVLYTIQNGYDGSLDDGDAVHSVFSKKSNELSLGKPSDTRNVFSATADLPGIKTQGARGMRATSGFTTKRPTHTREKISLPLLSSENCLPAQQNSSREQRATKYRDKTLNSSRLPSDRLQLDENSASVESRSPYTKAGPQKPITWETAIGLLSRVHAIE